MVDGLRFIMNPTAMRSCFISLIMILRDSIRPNKYKTIEIM